MVNVKGIVDLFITDFRQYIYNIISHLFNLAQVQQKRLYARGNDIELEVLCQLEKKMVKVKAKFSENL